MHLEQMHTIKTDKFHHENGGIFVMCITVKFSAVFFEEYDYGVIDIYGTDSTHMSKALNPAAMSDILRSCRIHD